MKSLFGCAPHRLECDIKHNLSGIGLSIDQLGAVSVMFTEAANPFESLDSKINIEWINNYIQDKFPFMVRSCIFTVIYIFVLHTKGETKEKMDFCYDIPLIKSLQMLLNCITVQEQVCYSC